MPRRAPSFSLLSAAFSSGDRKGFLVPRLVPLSLLLPAALACAAPPLPKGGAFVAGSGSISGGGQSLTINQTSSRGVIDWRSFSIGNGRVVTFDNGSGATLNRVTGGDPSVLLGHLDATGSVWLINPQGVLVGPTGVVATGGRFVASALDVCNNAFMQGGALTLSGGGSGIVVNLGQIGSSGGDVFLISRTLAANLGSVDAAQGSAELAAGKQVLLQDAAGSQQVFVQTGSGGAVLNAGAIRAAQISLQAADGNVYALAGSSAAIRATGTATRDGHVWLVADSGAIHASGDIAATNVNGSGGTVETRGGTLDVSGATVTAGTWKLGAPTFTLGASNAGAVSRSLGAGTSVDVETSTGDLAIDGNVLWNGTAALTLGAAHSLTIAPNTTIANTGSGDLTLRADSGAIDNGGSIANDGTIDWSKSTGIVTALYDMNGSYAPGTLLANGAWTAAPYSGLVTQITGYRLVNNRADLQNIEQDLAGNYALGKDIDASGTTVFNPIGSMPGQNAASGAPFTGQFDGMGHTIDKLTPVGLAYGPQLPYGQGTSDAMGLFGVVGAKGVVRNVKITNGTIYVGSSIGSFGLLVGVNYGLVTYSSSSGSISDGIIYGAATDGGLVGSNYGTVERSSSSASISTQGSAGGLVGDNYGTIAQSFADGSQGRGSHGGTGGLVSGNAGLITQSYVTGYTADGGLVDTNDATGVIDESFAANLVGGPGQPPGSYRGGAAAWNYGTIRDNVYWDKTVTTQAHAFSVGNGPAPPDSNGLTTPQMSTPSSFAGWNFGPGGAWAMPAGATHPVLQWQQAQ
ncbi:filamentous hemagglutinin outer membrane protein [Caballeronia hypogeia]|uniref:Filamentous hemagglutinin outer membrane protein n=1 Tax=Caballeronia hypogeia TaxID=1777140 RepID=A0A158BWC7_9BURK|nr:filamentous hemagglutinin N-terminal domain-containing protein [Caballeronia hypogeia]SAK74419.1 filamentous hemagglutinin outer membrane protein [Caballeronia hypogeia]